MHKDLTIKSLNDLFRLLNEVEYAGHQYIYRGHSKSSFPITSSLARQLTKRTQGTTQLEKRLLKQFKLWVKGSGKQLEFLPENDNTIDWLILAQHHGMPTRLIDFTTNPLVALYFACRENVSDDGALFVISGLRDRAYNVKDPFSTKLERPVKYKPTVIYGRIMAQSAVTVIQTDLSSGIEKFFRPAASTSVFSSAKKPGCIILRMLVPANCKRRLTEELDVSGVSEAHLFPGLDGAAKRLRMTDYFLKDSYFKTDK